MMEELPLLSKADSFSTLVVPKCVRVKILIVEQNPTLRGLLRSILELGHAEIAEANEGAAVLRALADYRPDWVLVDMMHRHLNAFDATRMIKQTRQATKVLLVAEEDSLALRRKAREAGAEGVLIKEHLYRDLRRTEFLPSAGPRRAG